MTRFKKKPIIVTVILLLGILLIWHLFFSAAAPKTPLITVSVQPVKQKSVTVLFDAIGNVQAYSSVDVKSMITGQLVKVGFKEGEMVQQGQILFQIDPRPFQAALDQANANLMRDEATLANNNLQVERNAPLLKKAFVSKQDFDTLRANAKATAATVNADKAAVETARVQLDYATIKAPITGKTGSISLKLGSLIKANDTTPLVTINQISPIYVTFSLSQDKLPVVQSNLEKGFDSVSALITNTKTESGKITFIDNAVAVNTGTILLKATFQNQQQTLWPGQYVNVKVPLEHYDNALLVPTLAVMTAQQGFYVFVVDDQDVAHIRTVTTGTTIDDQTVITQGLVSGEKVVVAGQLRLTDGAKVRIVAPSEMNS